MTSRLFSFHKKARLRRASARTLDHIARYTKNDYGGVKPEVAARGGVVIGSATRFSIAIIPLAVNFVVGLGCMLIRKRDETPVV